MVEHVGDAKIAQHAVPGLLVADEDVGRLHVLVDETCPVAGIQGFGHLAHDGQDGVLVAFQVDAADGSFGAVFQELELALLAFIFHDTEVVEVHNHPFPLEAFHQGEHGAVVAAVGLVYLQHLAFLHKDVGL